MAEYIKITGDVGNTIIDDSFRNMHLLSKHALQGASAQIKIGNNNTSYYPPVSNAYGFTFTVTSLTKPVVAVTGGSFFGIRSVPSGNNWTITVFLHNFASVGAGNMETAWFTFYVFGTATSYTKVTGRPVIEVFNNAGALVFSSALKPMKVVDFYSGDVRLVQPNFFNKNSPMAYQRAIPNHTAGKQYAIVSVSPARDAHNWQAGGRVDAYTSFTYIDAGSASVFTQLYLTSATQNQGQTMEVFIPALTFMVLDVTGY